MVNFSSQSLKTGKEIWHSNKSGAGWTPGDFEEFWKGEKSPTPAGNRPRIFQPLSTH